jgi:murein DD-endopeptidase MepM/ murein hydrolase activator NlpD
MQNILLSFLIIFFIGSCSSLKSGQYVYVEKSDQVHRVAKNHGLSVSEIKKYNPDKNFNGGEWIFIPSRIGIKYFLRDTFVIEDYSSLGTDKFLWPVPSFYKVSSHFGPRGRKHHDGIDIPAPSGTPIIAIDSGVVIYSNNGIRGYGNMIVIAHSEELFSVYAHNRKNKVKKGEKIKRGQMIAEIGNTGRSTGPHLHFEIRLKNQVRNPASYLSQKKSH